MRTTFEGATLPRLRMGSGWARRDAPSRTPEGHYGLCPHCGEFVSVTFSTTIRDAPCPCCGALLWQSELHWPFRADEPARAPRRIVVRPKPLARHLGSLVARVGCGLRAVLRPKASRHPDPLPAPASSSGVYDPWLDG